ncbi:MAG: STM4014 family protein [Isosphaeraceae bacterium]
MSPPVVVVGCPTGRRVALLQAALADRGSPPAVVIGYDDLLDGKVRLDQVVTAGAWLRIDSPERDFHVERALIAAGAEEPDDEAPHADRIGRARALRLAFDRGRLLHPRQWFLGFRALLRALDQQRLACPPHRVANPPEEIATMFDKPACQTRFVAAGLPCPRPLGTPWGYDDLRGRMAAAGLSRVFVKLAHGSSASGIVALAAAPGKIQAWTTVEVVNHHGRTRLYNTRAIRRIEAESEVAPLIDALCRERAQAERWVPKASVPGGTFDLRVVVIAGNARHVVARLSATPMTNLHLLNHRGDAGVVRARMTEEAWSDALRSCERAARLFPGSLCAGVDLVIASGFRRHALIEINAFGDLLPGVEHDGQDTYAAVLDAAGIDGSRSVA